MQRVRKGSLSQDVHSGRGINKKRSCECMPGGQGNVIGRSIYKAASPSKGIEGATAGKKIDKKRKSGQTLDDNRG